MELEFFSFSFLFVSLLSVFLVLKIVKSSKSKDTNLNLPPGPSRLPFIGNLHQLVGNPLPHHQLRDLAKKYGPFMHLQLGERSTVVVSSANFAEEVMKTHDVIFASRSYNPAANFLSYNSTDMIFAPYGNYWRQLRKLCSLQLLSKKQVQSFQSIREEEALDIIDRIAARTGSPINVTDKIFSFTNGVTSRATFGQKFKDRELFVSVIKETVDLLGGFSFTDLFPSIKMLQWMSGNRSRLEKLHQVTDRILENIIIEHKQHSKETSKIGKSGENEDLVDVLLKAQEDGDADFRLTTDNVKAVIWDIFSAGIDTAATTIDWVMSELTKNPKQMKKTQDEVRQIFNRKGKIDETSINEMEYLKAVIKETLRLHPPAPLIDRECRESCEIKGFEIPIKTKLVVNSWAIGRDPNYWSDPDSFIPERFLDSPIDFKGTNFEYLPFGGGRRICPGMSFGVANVELILAMLLYHFDWKLPNEMKPEDLDMTEEFGLTVKRKDDLCLIPISYHP